MFFKKLRSRMVAHIILIVSIVTIITFYFFYLLHQNSIEKHLKSDVQIFTDIVEKTLIDTMIKHDGLSSIKLMLPAFAGLHHIKKIRILNVNGQIKISSNYQEENRVVTDKNFINFIAAQQDTFTSQIQKGKITSFLRIRKLRNKPACHACHAKSQDPIGILWLETSDNLTENVLKNKFAILIIIPFGIIILLSFATELTFIRSIDKPVKKLTMSIKAIERGDYSIRIKNSGRDELGQLAISLNTMAEKLQRTKVIFIENHRKELQLAETLAKFGEYAASMAHEIKNPISGILFAINSILRKMNKDDPQREIFEEIVHQANLVERNLEALLNFARQSRLEYLPTNLNEIIEGVLLFISQQPDTQQIKIQSNLDPNLPEIQADPQQIEQVILNLVINSIQAMPNGGEVTVRTKFYAEKERVTVSIKDTGEGIPKEMHEKIFQPFFTTKVKGTGLGLTLCQETIIRHNGRIKFESAVEIGTIFIIELPVNFNITI